MKKVITFFVLMFALTSFLLAQTPQYYNANSGGIGNSIPFGSAAASGYKSQYLMLPNEYLQPSPAPAGNITKFYIYMSTAGTGTYTQFTIKMGQSTITVFPTGVPYTGQLDTVYYRASGTFTSTGANTWMMITLDRPYTYNPAQSLIIEISHCGITGAGMNVWQTAGTTGIFRRNNIGGTTSCVFTYAGQDSRILQCGVDISTTPPPCSNFSSEWTTTYAAMPDPTNGSRVIPSGITINDTGYVFIMGGNTPVNTNRRYNIVTNTWDTRTPMPVAIATTTGVTVRDSIYIIGGYLTGGTISSATYRYNPRADSWATKTAMPTATMNADMVVLPWKDSLIICIGGDAGVFAAGQTTAVRVYNVYTDTWQNLSGTSLLPIGNAKQGGAIVGDTLFTFGGFPNGVTSAAVYRGIITAANPISIAWTTAAPMPTTIAPSYSGALYRVAAATVKAMNRGIVLLGGGNGTFYNGIAHLYNPCLNTYTALNSATGSAKNNLGATMPVFKDSLIYFCAGYSGAGTGSVLRFAARCYYCLLTGVTGNNSSIPLTYSLSQNYPNPFNPVTKISFDIPKSGLVTIKVYDIVGKEIATLVNETKNAGRYIIDFDGTSLSSGTYFYRMESNGFIATKKMLMIK